MSAPQQTDGDPARGPVHDTGAPRAVITDGLPSQLPDIDPDETQEWLDSLDAVVGHAGPRPGPLSDAAAARAQPRAAGRRPVAAQHRLHQHHPAGARALVPGRRARRAAHPRLHPLERGDHGAPRAAPRHRRRRAHLLLRVVRVAVRGRLQPLLPRQGPPGRRRPDLVPGARLPRHLRPRLPRGPAHRGPARRVPPGGQPPRRRPVVLPAPAADAGLLGVPHRLDGPGPPQRHLPGAVQPLPARPRHQGHLRPARVGVPRRRRDGRARVAGRDRPGRPRGARQPHVRHQLQPAAPRRPGARQRQDHPGDGVVLPRRRLERHQGDLGPRVGRAAGRRPRRRPGQPDEPDARRRLPDLQGRGRRLRPRALLRP